MITKKKLLASSTVLSAVLLTAPAILHPSNQIKAATTTVSSHTKVVSTYPVYTTYQIDGSGRTVGMSESSDGTGAVLVSSARSGEITIDCAEAFPSGYSLRTALKGKGFSNWLKDQGIDPAGITSISINTGSTVVKNPVSLALGDSTAELFSGLPDLTTVKFGNNVDFSQLTDVTSMFEGTAISDIEGFDTSHVQNMSKTFYKVTSKSLNIRSWNTSSVTNMSEMFAITNNLENLDLRGWNTSQVTDMSNMFNSATAMTSLNLSGIDTSNVTSMSSMFRSTGLTSLDLSGFDTSNVTDMNGMFAYSRGLKNLDLGNFNTSKVTDMGSMFSNAEGLTNINLSSFDTSNVESMGGMFLSTKSLTQVDLSNFNTSKVTDMGMMFSGASNLKSLDVSNFDTTKVTSMRSMLSYVSGLKSLDLSNFDTANVTDMYHMFSGDSNLTSLDLSGFDTTKVTTMNGMFSDASGLKNLNMSTIDTISSTSDTTDMFKGTSINQLTLGARTRISKSAGLDSPETNDQFTGKWQNIGTGSHDQPNGSWIGTTAELIVRSGAGVLDTYVWQPIVHDYVFNADNINIKASEVEKLDIINAANASVKDNEHPDTKFTVEVKDKGGLKAKAGTYTVTLGVKEIPSLTKTITVTVEEDPHDYVFNADDISIKTSEVAKLDIIKASKASVKDNKNSASKFTVVVKDKGGLKAKAGTYTVTLGVKEVPSLTKKIKVKVTDATPKPDATYQTMYRVYNKNTGEHLYTASAFERNSLVKGGWSNEGIGWKAPTKGTAVYRVYNPNAQGGDHYYTASKFEAQSLVKTGWKWDNGGKPVFYSGGKTKVYVAYNPNAKSGSHNYTTSQFEQNTLLSQGWKYGKVQFYGK